MYSGTSGDGLLGLISPKNSPVASARAWRTSRPDPLVVGFWRAICMVPLVNLLIKIFFNFKTYFIDRSGARVTTQVHDALVFGERITSPAVNFVVNFEVKENPGIGASRLLADNFEEDRIK